MIYWMTGLSGSGKTTLAKTLNLVMLDGDAMRNTISKDLGFSIKDRKENTRRIACVANIINKAGQDVVVSTILPTEEMRNIARVICGDDLKLIYINSSIEECASRDVKGLYKKYYNSMTGVGSPYDIPQSPDLIIDTENNNISKCVSILKEYIGGGIFEV